MTDFSLTELNEKISQKSTFVKPLLESIEKIVVGQKEIVSRKIIIFFHNQLFIKFLHIRVIKIAF